MAVLKKLKASSLNEVIVATIIIVLIFSIGIAILNNITGNIITSNTTAISSELNELVYKYKNKRISVPNTYTFNNWKITASLVNENKVQVVVFEAVENDRNKIVTRKTIAHEEE